MLKILFLFLPVFLYSENRNWQKDLFGRNFRVNKQKYYFSIDEEYKRVIPDLSQVYLHLEEAKELENKKRYIDAIQLNQSILVCSEFGRKDRTFIIEAKKNLGRVISKYSDLEKKIQKLTDVTACANQEELIISNESFPYKIFTDSRFSYIFPRDEYRFAKEDREFNSKFSYFKMEFDENKLEPSLQEMYEKYNHDLRYDKEKFITLMIGEVYFKENFSGSIIDFWDNRRGLNSTIKKSIGYERKELENFKFESEFFLTDKSRLNRKFLAHEMYFVNKQKSILVMIFYPSELLEVGKEIFQNLKIKF